MFSRIVYGSSALLLVGGVSLALAHAQYSLGPPPSHSGAHAVGSKPEEPNCQQCHLNFAWNNLNTPGGAVEILDLPKSYEAGRTYTLTVRLHSDSTVFSLGRKWGFQMTAVRASDGGGCGTFVLGNNDSLQIVPGEAPFVGRSYVEHTSQGTRTGLDGPVSWTFDWRAPDPLEGPVYFFCAGNAADGTFDPGNDFIYTTADTVPDIVTWTPVAKVSWGSLKARYR